MRVFIENHIKQVFEVLKSNSEFKIYDSNIDVLPDWIRNLNFTNTFLVCCSDKNLKDKLKKFLSKEIFENNECIYWFEGEKTTINDGNIANISEENKIVNVEDNYDSSDIIYLKTNTTLPSFLDKFIYKKLNAVYSPDYIRYQNNLDLNEEEIREYLGTYFPRSYAESFCIFDNIFQFQPYNNLLSNTKTLNLLSIGCGTGGDIIGLLICIDKYFCEVDEINIYAVDGNICALNILEKIIDNYRSYSYKRIKFKGIKFVFNSISDFDNNILGGLKFDYILSFKFINEIISTGNGVNDNSYYDFTKNFLPLISDKGLFVLLDVTTKQKHTTYNPILMNQQINRVLIELNRYETLIPIPCRKKYRLCNNNCFQQKTFSITHSKHSNDISKVAYRVIITNLLDNQLDLELDKSKQIISKNEICPHTHLGEEFKDAFFINKQTNQ